MTDLSKHLREQAAIFRQEDSLGRGAKELEAAAALIEALVSERDMLLEYKYDYDKVIRARDFIVKEYGFTSISGMCGENVVHELGRLAIPEPAVDAQPVACYQCKGCGDSEYGPWHCVRCSGTGKEPANGSHHG